MHLNSAFNGAADFSVDTRRITFCDVINFVVDILCRRQLSLDADFASQSRILGFQLKIKCYYKKFLLNFYLIHLNFSRNFNLISTKGNFSAVNPF